MKITVKGGTLSQKEIDFYIDRLRITNPDKLITSVNLTVDGDYVDMDYKYESKPFERIRRITGYLVGTMDRFNDAKRSEVEDRVKHTLTNTER